MKKTRNQFVVDKMGRYLLVSNELNFCLREIRRHLIDVSQSFTTVDTIEQDYRELTYIFETNDAKKL